MEPRAITGAVVREEPLNGHAHRCEPGDGTPKKPGRGHARSRRAGPRRRRGGWRRRRRHGRTPIRDPARGAVDCGLDLASTVTGDAVAYSPGVDPPSFLTSTWTSSPGRFRS
jgi:hypothetical protein